MQKNCSYPSEESAEATVWRAGKEGRKLSETGKIHVYTGNGKGKTTASIGLALRFLGAGGRVFFAQFIKGPRISSEFKAFEQFGDSFVHKTYGDGRFVKGRPARDDVARAETGLAECAEIMAAGHYGLVILDELNCAISAKLLSVQAAVEALSGRAANVEVVVTGRGAPREIIDLADLVSEINAVKHYYDVGVKSRKGIEF